LDTVDYIHRLLYYTARRCFGQQRRAALKVWMGWSRKKFASAYRAAYGQFTAAELMAQFREMIQEDFDILMVHSAYDRLLPMYSGTLQELVNELIAFCGPNRTLAMPAFLLGAPDYDPIQYYRTRTFDVRRTISESGLPTEVFRRKPGVKRSLHPTHSVCALGPLAEELTSTHHLGTTKAGKHSPFEVMAKKRTVVIGIGVEYYRSLTQAKSIEDIMGDAFPVACSTQSLDVRMLDEQGAERVYPLKIKKFAQPVQGSILRSLMSPLELMERRFHGVPLWKTSAHRVTECLLAAAPKGITFYGKVLPKNMASVPAELVKQ
jgi:aminoglycoside 3-N-acetyltransferase